MKPRSLLSHSLWQFVCCIAVVFALSAPLFYLLTEWFYAEDVIDIIETVQRGEGIPPIDLERDIMAGMMLQFLLIFLVVSLSLFITLHFVTRRLWLPFDDTLRKAERFKLAQDSLPHFAPTGISEFQRLNQSLQRLMSSDRHAFRIQKEFTENASHELQTPLAVVRSKLDLLIQEDLTARQMQLVADLYELTRRMEHLNRNLLLLAKIENAQYVADEAVDVVALLASAQSLTDALQGENRLRVLDRRTDSRVTVRANSVLLDCLLKNLAVNALRHSSCNGRVEIVVEDARLTVSNAADDGRPLDADRLFRRFSTGDVRHKGCGLGLPIVKAICDLHRWTVAYSFEDGRHSFTVSFGEEGGRVAGK
ncbi:MAG: sensor histidine kinase [Alloprevotella sp.]